MTCESSLHISQTKPHATQRSHFTTWPAPKSTILRSSDVYEPSFTCCSSCTSIIIIIIIIIIVIVTNISSSSSRVQTHLPKIYQFISLPGPRDGKMSISFQAEQSQAEHCSSSPVLTATLRSHGKGQNSTPYKIKTLERIGMKFGTADYVLEICPQTKFGDDRSSGGCNGQVGMWRPILWTSK